MEPLAPRCPPWAWHRALNLGERQAHNLGWERGGRREEGAASSRGCLGKGAMGFRHGAVALSSF